MVMPVSLSPARIARSMGAAPRQRGSSEAWTFRQPSRRRRQHRLRQDEAVGGDHRRAERQLAKTPLLVGVPQALRSVYGKATALRVSLHRRAPEFVTTASLARGLRIDRRNLIAGVEQCDQRRQRKRGASEEGDAHGRSFGHCGRGDGDLDRHCLWKQNYSAAAAEIFFVFASLRRMMLRFSDER